MNGGTYNLKSIPYCKIFQKFFYGNFVYSHNFWQESAKRKAPWNWSFTFRFSCKCLIKDLNRGLTSNKPTHYLLSNGDCWLFVVRKFETLFQCQVQCYFYMAISAIESLLLAQVHRRLPLAIRRPWIWWTLSSISLVRYLTVFITENISRWCECSEISDIFQTKSK